MSKDKTIDQIVSSAIERQSSLLGMGSGCSLVEVGRSYEISGDHEATCVVSMVVTNTYSGETGEPDLSNSPKFTINIKLTGLNKDELQSLRKTN